MAVLSIGGPDAWVTRAKAWQELGATHLAVNTMGLGLEPPDGHVRVLEEYMAAIRGAGLDPR